MGTRPQTSSTTHTQAINVSIIPWDINISMEFDLAVIRSILRCNQRYYIQNAAFDVLINL